MVGKLTAGLISGNEALIRAAVDQGVTFFDTAQVYGPGSRAPISGLGVGEVFRTAAGDLVLWGNPALVSGDYTRRGGNSDNNFVWVDFGPVFQVP